MEARPGRLALVLVAGGALGAFLVTVIGGAARPGYDHASQFISELGERGSADGFRVSWFGFVPPGLLAIAFGIVAAWILRSERRLATGVAVVAVAMGAAYVISAFARCEPGCPSSGDVAQTVHNLLGGALGYVGAVVGMVLFGLTGRRMAAWRAPALMALVVAPAVAVLSSFLEQDTMADHRGTYQRVCEVLIWGWLIVIGIHLSRPRPPTHP
jgi:hypothetical protein